MTQGSPSAHPHYGAPAPQQHHHHHQAAAGSYSSSQQQQQAGGYYPPVPAAGPSLRGPGTEPAAGNGQAPAPGHVLVETPKLEAQPWVKNLWNWLGDSTTGIARVDLCRPTPPYPEQYQGSLFFASYKGGRAGSGEGGSRGRGRVGGWGWRRRSSPPPQPIVYPQFQMAGYEGVAYPQGMPVVPAEPSRRAPTGARIKITRSFLFGRNFEEEEEKGQAGAKAAVDLGAGINLDMDRQRLEPVLRLKIKDLFSIKLVPRPVLKISRAIPLWNTGMGLKLLYEVPLTEVNHFWEPPARLMLRLDQVAGSGVHVTPAGIEIDQQSLRFGRNITIRASAGLSFPRSLPIDWDSDDIGIKVHRLSLKTLW